MKKIIMALLATATALTSCSQGAVEEAQENTPTEQSRAEILLNADIQASTETRAEVSGTTFPASTNNVFRLTAYKGTAAPSSWATAYFTDQQVNSGVSSALSLNTAQYYPANATEKLYFYAYAPAATSVTAGTASAAPIANYTITGDDDIMAAQATTGIAKASTGTQSQPSLAFTHKLKQVKFKLVKDASFESGIKVTNITVKGAKTSAKLNISTGTLTFDSTPTGNLVLPITAGTNDEIVASPGTSMTNCLMFESGATFTLSVTAGGITYSDITVTLTNGSAGSSYLVTLTFKRNGITPTASISNWTTATGTSIDVI